MTAPDAPHALRNFTDNPVLRADVAAEIAAVYTDPGWFRPDVSDVIAEVLATVRADIRDRAEDQACCNKVDDCTAKAIVLSRLADWLEGLS